MRRADRLFDIIQRLRTASTPITAASLATALEVTTRTIYRDIAALQARRVPIEGEAGIGYVLRPGFDLPPLMFTIDEIDAIAVGARLVRRIRDPKLHKAAEMVLAKLTAVIPESARMHLASAPFYVSGGNALTPHGVDLSTVRSAIRERQKIHIVYVDQQGTRTSRTIWPVAMVYYVDVTLVAAWCELRNSYRHFRVERVETSNFLADTFPVDNGRLLREWRETQREGSESADVHIRTGAR
jgi:predicted DNA-binding transcriptional regulator YafY